MPLFNYTRDIPDGPNNPSQDQPNMKTNTNSTDDLIEVDHYSFNDANGGLHKQVQMPDLGAIPAGLAANQGTLYVKVADGTSQLFYSNENSTNEYQLTRTNNADFPNFGVNTVGYSVGLDGGWTFLPGGMLLQYGSSQGNLTDNDIIEFPKAFSTGAFSIIAVPFTNSASARTLRVFGNNTTQFQVRITGGNTPVFWIAIGV